MFKKGDVCELKPGVDPTINREGEPIRLFPERFTVGYLNIYKGVIVAHVAGVKVEVSEQLSTYYNVTGSVGTYPEEKVQERLDKLRSDWLELLGDEIPTDGEVRGHIEKVNQILAEEIPSALGVYQYQFTGVYMDEMKRVPMTRLVWIPPTPGTNTERSQSREDNPPEHHENQPGPEPEDGRPTGEAGEGEASAEGSPGLHATHEAG